MFTDKALILNSLKKIGGFTTNAEFARFLNITPQNLSNWYKRNTYDVNLLANLFTNVNKEWLVTGEGKMLKEDDLEAPTSAQEGESSVLLLPISAQGGSLNDFAVSVNISDCERIISPIRDADFAMSVTGDSMEPEYPSGSKILIKKINERAFIEWGRCYVLDTCNGTVVKKLMPSDNPEKLKCVSTNIEYPPFDVFLTDIFGVYRVLMMLAEK